MSTPHQQNNGNSKKNDTDTFRRIISFWIATMSNNNHCNKTTGLYYIAMFLYVISDFMVACYI